MSMLEFMIGIRMLALWSVLPYVVTVPRVDETAASFFLNRGTDLIELYVLLTMYNCLS